MTETNEEVKQLEEDLKQIDYEPIQPFWEKRFFKDKEGNKLTPKEFLSRWKEGMQNLTPVQKTTNDLVSTIIILVGFIASVIALIFFNKTFGVVTYGLILIFLGNVYSNVIKCFLLVGQYKMFKNIENQLGELNQIPLGVN